MVFLVSTIRFRLRPTRAGTPGARLRRRRPRTAALWLGALAEPRGIAGGVKRDQITEAELSSYSVSESVIAELHNAHRSHVPA